MTGADPRDNVVPGAGHPRVSALVRRGHGRVPVARPGRRADGDVAARRGDAREAAARARSRSPALLSRTAGDTRSGRTSAPSTATARWHRSSGRRPIRGSISPAWRGSSAPTRTRSRATGTRRSAPCTQPVADELPPVASRLRRVIGPDSGGGRFNVGPERQPGRAADRVLLGAGPVLGRAVSRRRRDRRDHAQAGQDRDRSALRQPRVPELGRRVESRRPHARHRRRARRAAGRWR